MKHKKLLIALGVLLGFLFNTSTFANTINYMYVGADVLHNQNKFKTDYGLNIFSDDGSTLFNIYLGHYFASLLGFECGYEQIVTRHSVAYVSPGTSQFGIPVFTSLSSNVYKTKKSLQGFNFNYVPQFKISKSISIIAVLGLSYLETTDQMDLVLFDGAAATTAEQANYKLRFVEQKIIPRLGLRLQYIFSKYFGIRVSYVWENTALLQPTAVRQINPNQTLQAKLTNSSAFGLGVFIKT